MPDSAFDYVKFLDSAKQEADSARKPREQMWAESWDLYHNKFSFKGKADWQAKIALSRFAQTVDTWAAIGKRAMLESREFYMVEGEGNEDKQKAPVIKRLTDLWLRLANFVVTFTDALKLGGITDLIPLKVTWPEFVVEEVVFEDSPLSGLGPILPRPVFKKKRQSGLKIELLDPFKVWIDPSGRNRYCIEETITDLDQLKGLARRAPDSWDIEAIGRLEFAAEKAVDEYREASRKGLAPKTPPPWRKEIRLTTFWGDIIDETGKVVGYDMTLSVADGRELVGKARPIKSWHKALDKQYPNKRGPIIWASLHRIPLSPIGKGFYQDGGTMARWITASLNNVADQTQFAGANIFEVDEDLIADPEQFKNGVFPGKVFLKKGNIAAGRPLIDSKPAGQVNPQSLAVLNTFERIYQNAVGVTDYVSSSSPAKQTPTLGEYQGRQAQALGFMDMMARNLEDQLLEPLLNVVYWLILQYMDDFTTPPVVQALGPNAIALASMTAPDRYNLLKANIRFKVRGMSVMLAKGEELQKVAMFLQVLPQLLQAVPQLAAEINWRAIFRKVIEGLRWDPEEVLVTQQTAATEMEAMQDQSIPQMDGQQQTMQILQAIGGLLGAPESAGPRSGVQG